VEYAQRPARKCEKRAGDYRHQYPEGRRCQLIISGEDEQRALAALSAFIQDEFPHCDTPLPAAESMEVQPVPESLSRLNPTLFHGRPVCAGSAGARSPI
jgi:fructose-specific PTS system IIA-like component